MPKKRVEEPDFEQSLKELEELVEQMEQGELSLEASLQAFERGVQLTRNCQKALASAEQKVQQLLEQSETANPVPFDSDEA